MKYLVISDTHGSIHKVLEIYRRAAEEKKPFDAVIHLGDYERDAENIMEELSCTMYSVRGNCDGDYGSGDLKVLDTEAGRILLTHGHAQKVKLTTTNLLYKAEELDCVAALFGHTHIPYYEEDGGITLFNPGSLTFPSDASEGSYGVLEIENGEMMLSIIYYSKSAEKPNKKVQGGHLRDMLNYSDRF